MTIPISPDKATILIVEDNPDNMLLFKSLILMELCPAFCDGRPSGAQLFGLLAARPSIKPDLILLDIQIPNEDGYTILKQIRERPLLAKTRVVAVTANVMASDVERAREAGFDGFIGKPINPSKFHVQITRILEGESVWEIM